MVTREPGWEPRWLLTSMPPRPRMAAGQNSVPQPQPQPRVPPHAVRRRGPRPRVTKSQSALTRVTETSYLPYLRRPLLRCKPEVRGFTTRAFSEESIKSGRGDAQTAPISELVLVHLCHRSSHPRCPQPLFQRAAPFACQGCCPAGSGRTG